MREILPVEERDSKGDTSIEVVSFPLGVLVGALLSLSVGFFFPESIFQIALVFVLGTFGGTRLIRKILNKLT